MGVFAGTAADRGTGAAVAATAAVAGLAGLWYMTATTSSHSPPQQSSTTPTPTPTTRTNVTPSPLTTQIPHLTPAQAAALPYPPGSATTATTTTTTTENLAAALPGGRDVPTAYGSIRVYEWGPEDPAAEKVLLVHGISTPCIALGDLAWELVGKGCRVMLFDLFGRGYSDAPNDIPYDARLYTTQMLLVLASSELSWLSNGGGGFHLVGYSFGGCLCVAFAAQFPHLLRSLNLVATSGLMRPHHVGRSSRWLYESRILPEWLVRAMVRRRIRPPLPSSTAAAAVAVAGPRGTSEGKADSSTSSANASEPKVLLLSEATNQTPPPPLPSSSSPGTSDGQSHGRRSTSTEPAKATTISRNGDASGGAAFDSASLSRSRPDVTVSSVVRWQVDHHAGFVGAFLSTIRESPIYAPSGDADWRALRRILSAGGGGSSGSGGSSKVSRQQKEEAVDIVGDGVSAAPAAAAAAGMGAAAGRAGRGGLAAKGKILIVLGGKDSVIDCAETVADATAILNGDDDDADANGGRGEESSSPASRVEFVILEDVGHEIPITSSAEVADALVGHWREVTVMGTAKRSV